MLWVPRGNGDGQTLDLGSKLPSPDGLDMTLTAQRTPVFLHSPLPTTVHTSRLQAGDSTLGAKGVPLAQDAHLQGSHPRDQVGRETS